MRKGIVAKICLVLLMLIGSLNVSFSKAYAESAQAKIEDTEYETLIEAINIAETNQTVTLLNDVSISETINISKSFTLDLNGFTVTCEETLFVIDNQDVLMTVRDSSLEATGKIVAKKAFDVRAGDVSVEQGEIVTQEETTPTLNNPLTSGNIATQSFEEDNARIKSYEVKYTGYPVVPTVVVDKDGQEVELVPGSDYTVEYVRDEDRNPNANGVSVKVNIVGIGAYEGSRLDDQSVMVMPADFNNDVEWSIDPEEAWLVTKETVEPEVTGKLYSISGTGAEQVYTLVKDTDYIATYSDNTDFGVGKVTLDYHGGASNILGTSTIEIEFPISQYEAYINTTYYKTLQEAFDNATDGDTICLSKDIVLTETLAATPNVRYSQLTLDLGNYKISNDPNFVTNKENPLIRVGDAHDKYYKVDLNVKGNGGTIETSGDYALLGEYGSLTLEEGITVKANEFAAYLTTVRGYYGDQVNYSVNLILNGPTIITNGTSLGSNNEFDDRHYRFNSGEVTSHNGYIFEGKSTNVTISDGSYTCGQAEVFNVETNKMHTTGGWFNQRLDDKYIEEGYVQYQNGYVDKDGIFLTVSPTESNLKGSGDEPAPVMINKRVALPDGTDVTNEATLVWTNEDGEVIDKPVYVGTYTLTATYNGKESTATFTMHPAPLSEYSLGVELGSIRFNGQEIDPSVLAYRSLEYNEDNFPVNWATIDDFEVVSVENNIEPGTMTATLKGKNNFTGTITGTWEISEANFEDIEWSLDTYVMPYNPSDPTKEYKPVVTGVLKTNDFGTDRKDVFFTLPEEDYIVEYANNTSAGTATVTIKNNNRNRYVGDTPVVLEFEIVDDIVAVIERDGKMSYFKDLQSAFNNARNGETVELWKDLDETGSYSISGKDISFHLNGHALNNTDSSGEYFTIQNNAKLNVFDNQNGSGIVSVKPMFHVLDGEVILNDVFYVSRREVLLVEGGKATLNSGHITANADYYGAILLKNGEVSVKSGSVNGLEYGIKLEGNGGKVDISGGYITAKQPIHVNKDADTADIAMSGGSLIGTGSSGSYYGAIDLSLETSGAPQLTRKLSMSGNSSISHVDGASNWGVYVSLGSNNNSTVDIDIQGGSITADYFPVVVYSNGSRSEVNVTIGGNATITANDDRAIYLEGTNTSLTVDGGLLYGTTYGIYTRNIKSTTVNGGDIYGAQQSIYKDGSGPFYINGGRYSDNTGSSSDYIKPAHTSLQLDSENWYVLTPDEGIVARNKDMHTYYMSLEDAFREVEDNQTIELLQDTTTNQVEVNKNITFDLAGKTVTGSDTTIFKVNDGGLTIVDSSEEGSGTLDNSTGVTTILLDATVAKLDISQGEIIGGTYAIDGSKFHSISVTGGSFKAETPVHLSRSSRVLSGGIYSSEPNSSYVVNRYVAVENTDPSTKAEYPYSIEEGYVVSFNGNWGRGYMYPVTVAKDSTYTIPKCEFKYDNHVFDHWEVDGQEVTSIVVDRDKTVVAIWAPEKYTVRFVNDDESLIKEVIHEYGTRVKDIDVPEDPTKPSDAQYSYTFIGWTPDLGTVNNNITYKATYKPTINTYTVTFEDSFGTILDTQEVEYGSSATAPTTPTKEGYRFMGWDKEFTRIEGDLTVKAVWVYTEELEQTISDANTLLGSVIVSDDGSELTPGTEFVTPEVKKALEDAIAVAQSVFDDQEASQAEIDQATADLETAMDEFTNSIQTAETDKTALEAALNKADQVKQGISISEDGKDLPDGTRYVSEEDNQALLDAIGAAEEVFNDSEASQDAVDEATQSLTTAIDTYEKAIETVGLEKEALRQAITDAQESQQGIATSSDGKDLADGTKYVTPEEKQALDQAIEQAKQVLNHPESTQHDIDNAIAPLNNAKDTYTNSIKTATVDKSPLEQTLTEADEIQEDVSTSQDGKDLADGTKYVTPEEQQALEDAIEQAKQVFDNPEASQNDVDAAKEALSDAMDAYRDAIKTAEVDKSGLTSALNAAQQIQEGIEVSKDGKDLPDETDYVTPEVQKALEDKMKAAQDVLDDPKASQNDVDEAEEALLQELEAYVNAVQRTYVDKQGLDQAVTEAKESSDGIVTSSDGKDLAPGTKYVEPEVQKELEDALDKAKKVLDDPKATQNEVDSAEKALKEATKKYKDSIKTAATNKDELQQAIDYAVKPEDIIETEDGKDVPPEQKWATPKDKQAYMDALDQAKEILNNPNATQNDVDQALANLNEAASKIKNGGKVPISYDDIEGDGNVWVKGSGKESVFRFKRSVDDASTINHFTGIKVDNVDVAPSNYMAQSGSVIVRLKPSYLETLSLGTHSLTALFDDGNSVTVKFTIVKQTTPTNDKTTVPTNNKTTVPNTSDDMNLMYWGMLFMVSLLSTTSILHKLNRSK